MRVIVVELYRAGVRLSRDEARRSEVTTGELIVDVIPDNTAGRPLRKADLVELTTAYRRPLLPPLFEPQIIRMKSGDAGFVLRGWQIAVRDGTSTEFAQEWWCRLSTADAIAAPMT